LVLFISLYGIGPSNVMRLQLHWTVLLLMVILLFPASIQKRALADGCDIEITRTSPTRLPQATKPGEIIVKFWFDVTTSDPQNTQLSVEASGNNIDVLSKTISMSTGSGSVRIYVHTEAGERASLTIKITCRVNGVSDTDTKDMGSSYIVYIPPSWSPSVEPREVSKRGEITLEVDGLDDVDDGVGELSVTAKLGSPTYRLRRVSRGLYRSEVSVNFIDSPSGTKEITFTVTKSYGGVTAVSRKDSSVRVLGDPPSVVFGSPSRAYRGDKLSIIVSESDGDSLTGTLSAFGKEYALERGENLIEVPRDINAGQYLIEATVEDVDGSDSESWTLEVVNIPPQVEISLDKDVATPGDTVSVQVTVEDDSPGADVELIVVGNGFRDEFEMDESGGSLEFGIPDGFSGELTFTASAVDRDGASASSTESIIVGVPPSISGDIPHTVHRGEEYIISVRGDDVEGYLDFMGERFQINEAGTYRIVIPRNVKAGNYEIYVHVGSPFGEASERWDVVLENRPPTVSISVDPTEAHPGEAVVVSASYSDDAPGLKTTLYIDGRPIQLPDSSSTQRIEFTVPEGKDSIEITVEAVDMDGAVARDSVVLVVKDVSHNGNNGSGGGSDGSDSGSSDQLNSTGSGDAGASEGENGDGTQGEGGIEDRTGGSSQPSSSSDVGKSSEFTREEFDGSSQLQANVEGSKQDSVSSTTDHGGTLSVTVVPSNPEVGEKVSVTAIPHGVKGSVWVVDPEDVTVKEVPVINKTAFHFIVSKEGIWSVRWAYMVDDETIFGHMELNVTKSREESGTIHQAHRHFSPRTSTATPSINNVGSEESKIRTFNPSCRVLRKEHPRSRDTEVLLAVIIVTLLGVLIIRRRIS